MTPIAGSCTVELLTMLLDCIEIALGARRDDVSTDHTGEMGEPTGLLDRRSVSIDADDLVSIAAQARRESPDECCGVLFGQGGLVRRAHPTSNVLHSPVAFEVEPLELLNALLAAEAEGLDVVGYYHSHPASPAYPSPTDVRFSAGWPGAVHLIVSLAGSAPTVRAFAIDVADEPAEVLGQAPGAEAPRRVIRELEVVLR